MKIRRYIDGLIKSIMAVFGVITLAFLALTPFWLIMAFIQPPSLLGASLMFVWLLILIAIAISPYFMEE